VRSLLSEDGDLVTNCSEKADVLDTYSSSAFTDMASPQAYQFPWASLQTLWEGSCTHSTGREHQGALSYHFGIHKFMGWLGVHPRVFQELTAQSLLSPC